MEIATHFTMKYHGPDSERPKLIVRERILGNKISESKTFQFSIGLVIGFVFLIFLGTIIMVAIKATE